MQIANPIYDVVFKYLMDDNHIAKLLISAIIGEEILSLTFKPREHQVEIENRSLTVYRLDFSARIMTKEGLENQILIEIQKAKLHTDIMRFRKYLGEQYINPDNAVIKADKLGRDKKVGIPIISIYFLGHNLSRAKVPVIKVNRQYIDVATGEEITIREDFIESLTHNSFIIQIPQLKEKRRNELEILLCVFDQNNRTSDHHILNVNENDFPEKYRSIIRRLQRAIAEPQVRKTMDIEDEILEELQNMERSIAKKDEIIEQIIEKSAKALEEKEQIIEKNAKALEEKAKALEEKEKIIAELKKQLDKKG